MRISSGCPLSPLMGYLYLKPLDDLMKNAGCFYTRFMDNWLIIVPSGWKLRAIVRNVNQVLNKLKIEMHQVSRKRHAFSWLPYQARVPEISNIHHQ
ncbi:MAG: hypothetical protein HON76_16705 [Candidatus Scalindua sp.]|nr:hypothetical protein [Candidatus Scalindua sp.]MBT7591615.1 hypothetical protein [Candidatus Scalindua sp.]